MSLDSIIFDLDGTLWDATKEVMHSWNKGLDKFDEVTKKFTMEDIEGYMGTPIDKIFEGFLDDLEGDLIKKIEKEASKVEIEYVETHGGKLFPGIEDSIKKLAEKYKLFIVSNCQDGYIEAFLKFNNFEKYFMDFEHPGKTGLSKGENIKLIMERNKLNNSIYVGDTLGDGEAARAAGIPFIYARYGFGETSDYDFVIDEIEEIFDIIE